VSRTRKFDSARVERAESHPCATDPAGMSMPRLCGILTTLAVAIVVAGCAPPPPASPVHRIKHLIVIYQENWSFDGLFGKFPGANGLNNAGATIRQVDKHGRPYATLPPSIDNRRSPPVPDPRIPSNLPVAPFELASYIPPDRTAGNPLHRYYQQIRQINGGKMDQFVAWSDVGGLVMSYYDATDLPLGKLAQQHVLADNFFHAAFGGSFLNHTWLICACTPEWPDAPAEIRAQLDAHGDLVIDGEVSPDGYVVNTAFTVNQPHPAHITDTTRLLPSQTLPTIGDRLSDKGISWAWYSGGWNDALSGHPHASFQYHHQPFAYFAKYADGTPGRAVHLKDEEEFFQELKQNRLPAVSFVKPLGQDNEHPGYADLLRGQSHVVDLVRAVMQSSAWPEAAIIITYDENGGRWDHVPPPKIDRWGPGVRVPTVIVSPHARRGYVDHTFYDTTSILKFIEARWGLRPLGQRDAAANDLGNAFDWSR
jgi:phospholipase C